MPVQPTLLNEREKKEREKKKKVARPGDQNYSSFPSFCSPFFFCRRSNHNLRSSTPFPSLPFLDWGGGEGAGVKRLEKAGGRAGGSAFFLILCCVATCLHPHSFSGMAWLLFLPAHTTYPSPTPPYLPLPAPHPTACTHCTFCRERKGREMCVCMSDFSDLWCVCGPSPAPTIV